MSDVVDLLERLGASAQFGPDAAGASDDLLAKSSVGSALLSAMREGDALHLQDLLGQKPYVGVVMPAEEEDDESEGEGETQDAPEPRGRMATASATG